MKLILITGTPPECQSILEGIIGPMQKPMAESNNTPISERSGQDGSHTQSCRLCEYCPGCVWMADDLHVCSAYEPTRYPNSDLSPDQDKNIPKGHPSDLQDDHSKLQGILASGYGLGPEEIAEIIGEMAE